MTVARVPRSCSSAPATDPHEAVILVFGAARSGTTLLLNLMRCFAATSVIDGEVCSRRLDNDDPNRVVVGKREPWCAEHLRDDAPSQPSLRIIDIVRDPRDVVTSRLAPFPGYYCGFERWRRDVVAARETAEAGAQLLTIRYEDLIVEPDESQARVARTFGLTPRGRFSQFPDQVPPELSDSAISALGGLRQLSTSDGGRWRRSPTDVARVLSQLDEHPDMEQRLVAAGYPSTSSLLPRLRAGSGQVAARW